MHSRDKKPWGATLAGMASAFFLTTIVTCTRQELELWGVPASTLAVRITETGEILVVGKSKTADALLETIRSTAETPALDEGVVTSAWILLDVHRECPYQYVKKATMNCIRGGIRRITWRMDEEEVNFELPFMVVDPDQTRDGTVLLEEGRPWDQREDSYVGLYLFWANWKGQAIHSPTTAIRDYHGLSVSTEGAHVAIWINLREELADMGELARRLADLAAKHAEMCVSLHGRDAVPFKWVFEAVDASRTAGVRRLKLLPPREFE